MDEPSKGVLIPANRFEVLECTAALGAIAENAGHAAGAYRRARRARATRARFGVRATISGGRALCRGEERCALCRSPRADFDAVLDFVATGGYALKAYERFAKIKEDPYGRWRISNPMIAQRYRPNVVRIVEADMLKVRLVRSRGSKMIRRGGRILGEVEDFVETLVPGECCLCR